jgi:GTP-binding protein LepA
MKKIRNFCIIAHIDHGKSTLADRMLEITKTLEMREMKHGQMLDTMELEQERGITIKLQPVRMEWKYNGEKPELTTTEPYILNLIDTPGHVDFSYEVSRSLAACEGAILVVDATQGIQAQTLANTYMAIEHNLEIIPVLNKIDLPAADPEKRAAEIESVFGIPKEEIIKVSAKEGTNVNTLLDAVIERIPPPKLMENEVEAQSKHAKALIFDSIYDPYRGVVAYIRVKEGQINKGDNLFFMHNKKKIEALEVGYFRPFYQKNDSVKNGEIGYIITGQKSVSDARVGDTVWKGKESELATATPLPGYKKVMPFVFASIFTVDADDYKELREALEKYVLNDSSLQYEPERSSALGFGFRCGFLGLLHMDIVQERLEREYDLNLIITAPSVVYQVVMRDHTEITISNPSELPEPGTYEGIKEPWIKMEIVTPQDYVGSIMKICNDRRGIHKNMQYMNENRVILIYEIPLATVIVDFYDALKSATQGYASVSYDFLDNRQGDLVKVDILVAGDRVDPLAHILHRSEANNHGKSILTKLKDIIPKHQFQIALQAAIGGKVIARENISAMRKDVTAGLYGGDVTRKNKLRDKQKKGKKRLKMIGRIEMPQEAFLAILKKD